MSRRTKRPDALTWRDAHVATTASGGYTFTLPVLDSANATWRHVGHRTLLAASHRAALRNTRALFAHVRPLQGECDVSIRWYRAARVGDTDNRIKPVLDVLTQVAYADDKQVRRVSCERIDDPTSPARLVVRVEPFCDAP